MKSGLRAVVLIAGIAPILACDKVAKDLGYVPAKATPTQQIERPTQEDQKTPQAAPPPQRAEEIDCEWADLVVGRQMDTLTTEIQNLRLEDDIGRHEGRLSKNRIAIVKLLGRQQTDRMLSGFERDELRQLDLLRRGDHRLRDALLEPTQHLLDAVIIWRRANGEGEEVAIKAAKAGYDQASKQAQALALQLIATVKQEQQKALENANGAQR